MQVVPTDDGTSIAIRRIPVERLLLDYENPRLASGSGADTQKDLLKVLWNEMAVDEVALSIAANSFFPEEHLLAIPHNPNESVDARRKYVVVEGNRRLGAVLLLRDEALRREIGATDLPSINASEKAALATLPVSIYESRKELWQYFGFRHINGPKPWDAFSKAKYVASVHEKYDVDLKEIARSIGDRHATVVRLYRGHKLLEQAERSAGFRREDAVRNRFYFSHLYTAADQSEYQKFLGITAEGSLRPNPVPKSKLGNLRELMQWFYGSKSAKIEPVVRSQYPDLNLLREVISNPQSLVALRAGYSLERAHEISIGDARRFREALTRAKEDLQQAKATVTTGYAAEEDLFGVMESIILVSETIKSEMEAKRKRSLIVKA
jgi:hypothetical protein